MKRVEEWQKVMYVNLQGTFLCSKYAIPEIKKRGGGSIVNMASWHAYKTITRLAAYAASKGAIADGASFVKIARPLMFD